MLLIGRLSTTITACKDWVFRRTAARLMWYLAVLLALVLFWLWAPEAEIAFVYNAF